MYEQGTHCCIRELILERKQKNAQIKQIGWEGTGTSFELARSCSRFRGHFVNKMRKVVNVYAQIGPLAWFWAVAHNLPPYIGGNLPGWNYNNQPAIDFGWGDMFNTETVFTGTEQVAPSRRWCHVME